MTHIERKNYTIPIIMMIALFAMISFVTNLAAPMGVVLKNQFNLSNVMGMMGNFANFAAYACMGIPAGRMLSKIGYKKTALTAIVVGFVGIGIQYLSGYASSNISTEILTLPFGFFVYILGAFVAGFSMCMLNTVVNPMLNTLGGGGKKGNQLIQVAATFNSLSGTIVPMLVGALVGEVAKANITDVYPVMYIAMGIFALVFIVLSLVQIPEPYTEKAASTTANGKYSAWSFRHFILGVVAIFIYVGIEVGIPGTLNLFLADAKAGGLSAATAGFVVGTYWFLMLIGRFVGASVAGKVSSKAMLVVASSIGLLLVVLAIVSPVESKILMPMLETGPTGKLSFGEANVPINALFLVLCGFCTSVMWGGIFNLAVEGLGKYTSAASGIFMMMVCGGGILPLLQNFIADNTSYMTSYWVIFVGLAYILYYALIGSKNVNKNIPVE
ncbi:FHS family L-fucose permease-like MFS transporter [Dysgonomonas sp. PH5-45]|uniref:MFS transporter n=1 Tax=unclassified Dysgonomonas TaxID=2630389 RepID=UPI002473BD26|nr:MULTISPECIES: MFS transporter [unclassified Dysgonomonas]MDH6354260.1 FHS family L-fucose permease-like MFS transporter [Dysgonomonas sp. PH5-45]MDH6387161.1 FHS family L-fucose permease-like MFS transporter [Dysgonomonas sp. PH5-37]